MEKPKPSKKLVNMSCSKIQDLGDKSFAERLKLGFLHFFMIVFLVEVDGKQPVWKKILKKSFVQVMNFVFYMLKIQITILFSVITALIIFRIFGIFPP